MGIISSIIKIFQYFGFPTPAAVRGNFIYPVWKLLSFLSSDELSAALFLICMILMTIVAFNLKLKRSNKKPFVSRKFFYSSLMFSILCLVYLAISTYKYDSLHDLNISITEKNINIIVLPVFTSDSQSYLQLDESSIYLQETLVESLKNRIPTLPINGKLIITRISSEQLPYFMYTPTNINNYFNKIKNHTFVVWGHKINNNYEKICLEYNRQLIERDTKTNDFLYKMSDIVSVLFNELNMLPHHNRIEFLSQLIIAVIEQSLNNVLIENGDYYTALEQINKTIERIDDAFNGSLHALPESKRLDIDRYYFNFKNIFVNIKKTIEYESPSSRAKKSYVKLLKNLYSPHVSENEYFSWLSDQNGVCSVNRCFPVLNWTAYESDFETYVYNLLNSNKSEYDDKKISDMFDHLRKIHGKHLIIDYYEAIVILATSANTNKLDKIILNINKYSDNNYEFVERLSECYRVSNEVTKEM